MPESYDTPDQPHAFDISPPDETSDNYTASDRLLGGIDDADADADMLNTQRPEEPQKPDHGEGGEAQSFDPILPDIGFEPTVKQIYYDRAGTPHAGDHPNPEVQDALDDARYRVEENAERLEVYLGMLPRDLTEQYEELIAEARAEAIADFGPNAAAAEATFVTPEQYAQASDFRGPNGNASAFYAFGKVVVKVDPEIIAEHGDRPLQMALREQLAHAVGDNGQLVVSAVEYNGGIPYWPGDIWTPDSKHIIRTSPDYGWQSQEPDQMPARDYAGRFLDDAAAAGWALNKLEEADPEWAAQFDNYARKEGRVAGTSWKVGYANRQLPVIDLAENRITMPWRFAAGATMAQSELHTITSRSAVAAYGVHLLERNGHPGIAQRIRDSRMNPLLRPAVVESINSASRFAERPLYQRLATAPRSFKAYAQTVEQIAFSVGVNDKPVRS